MGLESGGDELMVGGQHSSSQSQYRSRSPGQRGGEPGKGHCSAGAAAATSSSFGEATAVVIWHGAFRG